MRQRRAQIAPICYTHAVKPPPHSFFPPRSPMAPPLIQLGDISLTFGGTPLLDGVELSVATGERVCLVGRNGSGKSTLLKIAAGLVEPDRGTRFVQPGATVRYLPQEPDLSAHPTTLAYVQSGLGPGDDPHQARYYLEQLGLAGDEETGAPVGRRGPARRAGAGAGSGARYPAARRADQPSRSDLDRMAGARARSTAHRAGPDQPRPALSRDPVAQHDLARSRQDPADRARIRRVRALARRGAGGGGARFPQARPQDRGRAALAALRGDGPAQAQRPPLLGAAEIAADPARVPRRRRQGRHRRGAGGEIRRAGDRGRPASARRSAPARSSWISRSG